MRRSSAAIAAVAAVVSVGIGVGAASAAFVPMLGPFDGQKVNVRHFTTGADGLSVVRRNGSYVVSLRNVSGTASAMRGKRKAKGVSPAFRVRAKVLPDLWFGRMGFNPNLAVTYTVNGALRTHYLRDAGRVTYNARRNSLTTVVPANAGNRAVVKQMRPGAARSVRAVFEPSPIRSGPVVPGRRDPAREMQTSTTPVTTGFVAAAPNAPYSIPYTTAVGTGGQTWKNLYSANGQIATGCETFFASQSGGTAATIGNIQIYETAAEVQQALSVGASMTYKVPLAKVTLDLGYSASSAQSTNSFYAVGMVSWQGAYVNLGAPTLTGSYSSAANSIFDMSDALGVMNQCGDSFPTGYQQGATWASILQIRFASQQEAQSAYASMKETVGVSFASTSATQKFSTGMSESASSSTITEIDQCWGIANGTCTTGIVPGYVQPSPSSVSYSTAMSVFTGNYNAMYSGVAGKCAPTLNNTGCATTVQYAPLQQAFGTANFSSGSPAQVFTQAAEGVYGVIQNFQAWEAQYQSMITGNPTYSGNSAYQANINALNDQANDCMTNLQDQACSTVVQNCAYGMMWNPTYVQPACYPTAFSSNLTLANMANPYLISNTTQPGS